MIYPKVFFIRIKTRKKYFDKSHHICKLPSTIDNDFISFSSTNLIMKLSLLGQGSGRASRSPSISVYHFLLFAKINYRDGLTLSQKKGH